MAPVQKTKMTNFRWVICGLLFLATTINYMDRQVLSLTWKDFIAPEFHWTDGDYGTITGIKDDTVTLSVGRDNLTMVVARWGIRSVEEVTIENDSQELN